MACRSPQAGQSAAERATGRDDARAPSTPIRLAISRIAS
jgi:hypothetical protein